MTLIHEVDPAAGVRSRMIRATQVVEEARALLDEAVVEARRERVSWSDIADCTGYASGAAASYRFRPVVEKRLGGRTTV